MSKQIVCIPAIVVFERKPQLVRRVIDLAEPPNMYHNKYPQTNFWYLPLAHSLSFNFNE